MGEKEICAYDCNYCQEELRHSTIDEAVEYYVDDLGAADEHIPETLYVFKFSYVEGPSSSKIFERLKDELEDWLRDNYGGFREYELSKDMCEKVQELSDYISQNYQPTQAVCVGHVIVNTRDYVDIEHYS